METFMILVVGTYVAVEMAWEVNACGVLSGFGMSTKAMLTGVGVAPWRGPSAGVAQLEKISAHKVMSKWRSVR